MSVEGSTTMANVLFTTFCNRSCSYCFARQKVDLGHNHGDSSMSLSSQSLEKVISFYRKSQLTRFVVLGGEPTLHPNFNQMVNRILEEDFLKSIIIFTNGLMPQEVLEHLSTCNDSRIGITLNLNHPDDYSTDEWGQINRTMATLGSKIGLGVNIYMPNQDLEYLISEIEEHHLGSHIRVGLTHPILGVQNRYALEEDFPAIAQNLVDFAEKAYRSNIGFSFDCGFRFCMFTLEQHKNLLRFAVKFKATCSPIIDIGPDLLVWRCFPLFNEANRPLEEFQNAKQITDFYEEIHRSFFPMGNRPECPECRYRTNDLCHGGCLARTMASFHR